MKKKEKFISQCCVCKKIRRKDGFKFTGDKHKHVDKWDHHKEELEEFHQKFDVVLSHGICEPCAEECMKELYKNISK